MGREGAAGRRRREKKGGLWGKTLRWTMRPLTEKEAKAVFEKLFKFVGKDVEAFLRKKEKESYCFRLQRNRIFYIREGIMRKSTNISRDKLISLGTQIGKFTHSGKFRLTITSLDLIAEHAKNKVSEQRARCEASQAPPICIPQRSFPLPFSSRTPM